MTTARHRGPPSPPRFQPRTKLAALALADALLGTVALATALGVSAAPDASSLAAVLPSVEVAEPVARGGPLSPIFTPTTVPHYEPEVPTVTTAPARVTARQERAVIATRSPVPSSQAAKVSVDPTAPETTQGEAPAATTTTTAATTAATPTTTTAECVTVTCLCDVLHIDCQPEPTEPTSPAPDEEEPEVTETVVTESTEEIQP